MKVPKKSKNQTNIPILLPKKYQKIYSTEYKHVEHLSNETKTKLVKKKIKKIKQLRDFEKIHELLNKPNDKKITPDDAEKNLAHWNTYGYLCEEIKRCILANNWNNLTRCLFTLTTAPGYLQAYVLKAVLINFTMNPAAVDNNLLADFLRECLACHGDNEMVRLLRSHYCLQPKNEMENNDSPNVTKSN